MPQLRFATFSLAGIAALLLSACATVPSPEAEREGAEPVESTVTTASPAVESDPLSELMFEVMAGELAGKLGDMHAAKEFYSRAAELSDDPDVIERAMRIAIFAKDWPLALKAAHRWSEVQDDNLEAQQVLGILYLRQGDLDSAEKYFSKVMDAAAIALARDNNLPIVVFSLSHEGGFASVLSGKGKFTIVEQG